MHTIILSNRWCTGHNLSNVNQCVILDMDMDSTKLTQEIGRVTRFNQLHDHVKVVTFYYRNWFDSFLYHRRDRGSVTGTSGNWSEFLYHMLRDTLRPGYCTIKTNIEDVYLTCTHVEGRSNFLYFVPCDQCCDIYFDRRVRVNMITRAVAIGGDGIADECGPHVKRIIANLPDSMFNCFEHVRD